MAATIAAFLGIACIALGAFMTVRAQRRGERGQAQAWYALAGAGGAGANHGDSRHSNGTGSGTGPAACQGGESPDGVRPAQHLGAMFQKRSG
jgi:hypothetical protein